MSSEKRWSIERCVDDDGDGDDDDDNVDGDDDDGEDIYNNNENVDQANQSNFD